MYRALMLVFRAKTKFKSFQQNIFGYQAEIWAVHIKFPHQKRADLLYIHGLTTIHHESSKQMKWVYAFGHIQIKKHLVTLYWSCGANSQKRHAKNILKNFKHISISNFSSFTRTVKALFRACSMVHKGGEDRRKEVTTGGLLGLLHQLTWHNNQINYLFLPSFSI